MPFCTKMRALPAIAVILAMACLGRAASGAIFLVTHIGDNGAGSLRQAMLDANATAGPDTVQFNLGVLVNPPVFINLLTPLPTIVEDVMIVGPGPTQVIVQRDPISNPGPFSIFTISGAPTVEIRGLAIHEGGAADGGGIHAEAGVLTVVDCLLFENHATNSGGAISMNGAGNCTLNVTNTSVFSNTATMQGGGVAVVRTSGIATVTLNGAAIERSNVNGLGLGHAGGGLYVAGGTGPHVVNITASTINDGAIASGGMGGGAFVDAKGGTLTLLNSTISGNGSAEGAALAFQNATTTIRNCTIFTNNSTSSTTIGVIADINGSGMTVRNTIISGNSSGGLVRDLAAGQIAAGNNNLIGVGGPFTNGVNGNIVGVTNPGLVPINTNGGPTMTFSLRPDSPALDAGSNADAPATDQRGQMRPSDGDNNGVAVADIGAFETQRYLVTTTANSGVGSLRQAILDNNTAGGGFIKFAIMMIGQAKTIVPKSPLPVIVRTAYIDGWSQGGQAYQGPPLVEIDGIMVTDTIGLDIQWSDCIVRGLAVNRFSNFGIGIKISSRSGLRNWIYGCYVGVGLDGTTPKGNGQLGVWIAPSANSNLIGTNADTLIDAMERNVISGSNAAGLKTGVYIESNSNVVSGNNIGTDVTGMVAIPNGNGVWVSAGSQNQIGTNTVSANPLGERNIIAGNANVGVAFTSQGANNFVSGNHIGVNTPGTVALPNLLGVTLDNVNRTLIGGTSAGERNVISGNLQQGVVISGVNAFSNLVQGNHIGTNAAGNAAIGNGFGGVLVRAGAVFNRIGAFGDNSPLEEGRRNVISGNAGPGVVLQDQNSNDNRVMGNYIGVGADGLTALGNAGAGVSIVDSPANLVGATGSGRNVIARQTSAVNGDGVVVSGTNSLNNRVRNNFIGVAADGSAAPNAGAGVTITGGALLTSVGGINTGEGNVIANNGGPGVKVLGDDTLANSILGNSIVNNGTLGIDLKNDGVTANGPANVVRIGPNNLQNYPVITATNAGGVITATLTAIGDTTYRVEFFSNVAPDPSGHGEGRTFLGFRNVTTDPAGFAGPFVFNAAVPPGEEFISATATELAPLTGIIRGFPTQPGQPLGTSEFAFTRRLNTEPTTENQTVNTLEDTDATITLTATDADPGSVFTFRIQSIPTAGQLLQFDGVTLITVAGTVVTDAGGRVIFRPAPNDFGSPYAFFDFIANDGTADSNQSTVTVNVLPVNDAPSFFAANPPPVLEDVGAVVVNPWVTAFSPGPGNESGQTVLAYLVSGVTNPGLFSAGPTVDNAGVLRYTPAANAFGSSQFTVRVQDNGGTANGGVDTSPPQTFTIVVGPVNDAPSFVAADPPPVLEDVGPVVVNPWVSSFSPGPANESTQTVLAYLVSAITNPGLFAAGGAPTVDTAGVLRYTPAANAFGSSQFTVRVQDNGGTASGGVDTSPPQTFTIVVGPVNDAPSFVAADPPPVLEDVGPVVVNPWVTLFIPGPANESTQTVLAYLVSGVTNPGLFSAQPTVDNAGVLRYTPAANAFGSSQFTVRVQDNGGTANGGVDTSPPQTFTIVVGPVNDAPSFVAADPPPVLEDVGPVVVSPWATSFSPGPANEVGQAVDAYLVSVVTNPALFTVGGQPTVDTGGVLRYTPAPDAFGSSQFTVRVRDNGGIANGGVDTSVPQTFTIVVGPVNDAPSFVAADPPPVLEDAGPVVVNLWVTSFSPGPVNEAGQAVDAYLVSAITNPGLFAAGGGPTVDNAGVLRYTPAANAFGSSQFTVRVRDNGGTANGGVDTSSPQTFTIVVGPVNDAPSFVAADPPPVLEDVGPVVVNPWVTAFSAGPANEAGQTVLAYLVSGITNPGLFTAGGQPTVDNAGVLRYTPALDQFGSSQITVRVQDDGGTANGGVDLSPPQTFTIVVGPVNDAPSFVAADPTPVLEDSGLATVANWASGFSPGPANESTQTNLGYQVSAITNPGLFAAGGAPTVDIAGTLRYTPAADAFGSSQFTVRVQDSGGTANGGVDLSPAQTFMIVVGPVNDPPTFVAADPPTVLEDVGPVVVNGFAHDFSPGPANEAGQTNLGYQVSGITNPTLFAAGGAPAVDINGVLRYTPAADEFGTSQFTVRVQDSGGTASGGVDLSAPQTFTITVLPVNDQPSFAATDPPVVPEDSGAQTVSGWVQSFSPGPANESTQAVLAYLVSGIGNPGLFAPGGLPVVDNAGTLTYTPAANVSGTSLFTVRVQDNGGTANGGVDTSAPLTFTIRVGPVNDPPSFQAANPPPVLEDSGVATVVNWATNFVPGPPDEAGQVVLAYIVSGVTNPSLFAAGGAPAVDNAGTLTYTPAADAFGSSMFTVVVQDNGGTANGGVDTSPPQTFMIVVFPVNDRPSFVAMDPPPVLEDSGQATVANWASGFNPGPANEAGQANLGYTVSGVTNAALFAAGGQPTVDLTGTLRYTPAPDANGSSQFTVVVRDDGGTINGGIDTSLPQTFTIVVGPVNDAPSFNAANPPPVLEDSGSATVVGWVTSFVPGPADEAGQTVLGYTVSGVTNPGLFSTPPAVSNAGTLTYTPAPDEFGTSQFTVVVRDSGGTASGGVDTSTSRTFTITVLPVNDKPSFTAVNPPAVLESTGTQTVGGFIASFNPGPANEATQTIAEVVVDQVSNPGLFSTAPAVNAGGTLSYTLAGVGFGTSTFRVRVRDSGGTENGGVDLADPQVFTIIVRPKAVCINVTLDARTVCLDLTVQPAQINGTPNTPGPGATQMIEFSRPLNVAFPLGVTPVTVTARYSDGLVSSCVARVTVLYNDCNLNDIADSCEFFLGQLHDCNADGVPDECQCVWDQGSVPTSGAATANGFLSHYGSGSIINKAADDFYLCPDRVYRIFSFTGQMITNSVLHKAVLEIYEDCDGKPAGEPFKRYTNSVAIGAVPAGVGFQMVTYSFDLCSDCLVLEGGRNYWVSLVGLTDFTGNDSSYWVTTSNVPDPLHVMGLPPLKRTGLGGPPPYQQMYQPWTGAEQCCGGCVNLAWKLTGEACICAWDHGSIDLDAGPMGTAGGTRSELDVGTSLGARAADDFIIRGCGAVDVCYLETWIWTNCNPVHGFAEVYQNECQKPGLTPIRSTVTTRVEAIAGPTLLHNGLTLFPYKLVFCNPGWTLDATKNYWLSSGAETSGSVGSRALFAFAGDKCRGPCEELKLNPGRFLDPLSQPLAWADTGEQYAFRLFIRDDARTFPAGPQLPSATPSCPVDINHDSTVNVQDIFAFLTAWFAACP